MVLAEGAGILILESEGHARARGAPCYAEIAGYSSASSAFSMLEPEPNGLGLVRTMKDTLREAGLTSSDVDFVNAQGFSLPDFDRMESRCIRDVFPDAQNGPWVGAVSSFIGNTIGASGGIQGVVSALALDRQMLPPHISINEPDAEQPLRLAGSSPSPVSLRAVMQNSYCFMGKHSSLIFKRVLGGIS
jgi:3-oxoacyl-[acyl-carrier-protein] synthase II